VEEIHQLKIASAFSYIVENCEPRLKEVILTMVYKKTFVLRQYACYVLLNVFCKC